jgi:hypothetical protein
MTMSLTGPFKRRWRAAWFALLTIFAGTEPGTAQTWIEWHRENGGNGHFYALTPYATNWTAAEALAESWSGTLAVIGSSNEQEFINKTFLTGKFEHLPVWIGLIRTRTNVTVGVRIQRALADLGALKPAKDIPFKWVTGERSSYSNWHPNQPDNFGPGENYTAMNWHYSDDPPRGIKGDWNDAPLNGTTGFGGTTDGPYFGLVELDPAKPTMQIGRVGVAAMLAVGVIIAVFLRRRKGVG